MCRNEHFSRVEPDIIVAGEFNDEVNQMRGIIKAMVVAYIMKKVKNKVMGRGSRKRLYRA